jgi:hypothetical protein
MKSAFDFARGIIFKRAFSLWVFFALRKLLGGFLLIFA